MFSRRIVCFAVVLLSIAAMTAPSSIRLALADSNGFTQERRAKLRISNAGFTITALPLLAAKDWGLFTANGLDMEVILMQSSLGAGSPDSRRHRLIKPASVPPPSMPR